MYLTLILGQIRHIYNLYICFESRTLSSVSAKKDERFNVNEKICGKLFNFICIDQYNDINHVLREKAF